MSNENKEEVEEVEEVESSETLDLDATDTTPEDTEDTKEEEEGSKWKALSRKNEKSYKEAAKALEEEQAKLTAAIAELETYKRNSLISKIAEEQEVPKEMLALLTGETEQELLAQARLIAGFTQKSKEQKQVIASQGNNSLGVLKPSRTEEVASFLRSN